MRNHVVSEMSAARFDDVENSLKKNMYRLSVKIFDVAVPKKIQKAMSELPSGSFCKRTAFTVTVGNVFMQCNLSELTLFPDKMRVGAIVVDDEKLNAEIVGQIDACHRLATERRDMKREVFALLRNFTTDVQLRKKWPEAGRYLPNEGGKSLTVTDHACHTLNNKWGLK